MLGFFAGTLNMADLTADIAALADRSLMVLDDDVPLRTRLGRFIRFRIAWPYDCLALPFARFAAIDKCAIFFTPIHVGVGE